MEQVAELCPCRLPPWPLPAGGYCRDGSMRTGSGSVSWVRFPPMPGPDGAAAPLRCRCCSPAATDRLPPTSPGEGSACQLGCRHGHTARQRSIDQVGDDVQPLPSGHRLEASEDLRSGGRVLMHPAQRLFHLSGLVAVLLREPADQLLIEPLRCIDAGRVEIQQLGCQLRLTHQVDLHRIAPPGHPI